MALVAVLVVLVDPTPPPLRTRIVRLLLASEERGDARLLGVDDCCVVWEEDMTVDELADEDEDELVRMEEEEKLPESSLLLTFTRLVIV